MRGWNSNSDDSQPQPSISVVNEDHVETLKAEVAALEAKRDAVQEQLSKLADQSHGIIQSYRADADAIISAYKQKQEELNAKSAALEKLLSDSQQEKADLDSGLQQLDSDRASFINEKTRSEASLTAREDQLKALKADIERNMRLLESAKEAFRLDMSGLEDFKKSLAAKSAELTQREFNIVSKESDLFAKINLLSAQQAALNEQVFKVNEQQAIINRDKDFVAAQKSTYESLMSTIDAKQQEAEREYIKQTSLRLEAEDRLKKVQSQEETVLAETQRLENLRKIVEQGVLEQGGK